MVVCFSPATFSHLSAGGNRLNMEFNQLWYFIRLVKWRERGKRSRDILVHQVNLCNCWNVYQGGEL